MAALSVTVVALAILILLLAVSDIAFAREVVEFVPVDISADVCNVPPARVSVPDVRRAAVSILRVAPLSTTRFVAAVWFAPMITVPFDIAIKF